MGGKRSNPSRDATDDALADEAALWLARHDRGLAAAEECAFQQWRAADPRHAAEFEHLTTAWRECDFVGAVPELVAMTAELDRAEERRAQAARRRRGWSGLLAAAAAVVLLATLAWPRLAREAASSGVPSPSYEVVASVAKRIVLDDGSVAVVRGDSEVRVEFSATERRIALLRGEAHFIVEKDPARPFVVSAGTAAVRAVGTAFNVRLEARHVEVIVTEGSVQVDDLRAMHAPGATPSFVVAGQRAVVENESPVGTSQIIAVAPAAVSDMEQVLGWQSTRLVFDRTPLADAVDAFNRHSSSAGGASAKLVIGDASLHKRRLGGTFRASNVDGFVRLLELSADVRVERTNEEIVLLRAR